MNGIFEMDKVLETNEPPLYCPKCGVNADIQDGSCMNCGLPEAMIMKAQAMVEYVDGEWKYVSAVKKYKITPEEIDEFRQAPISWSEFVEEIRKRRQYGI